MPSTRARATKKDDAPATGGVKKAKAKTKTQRTLQTKLPKAAFETFVKSISKAIGEHVVLEQKAMDELKKASEDYLQALSTGAADAEAEEPPAEAEAPEQAAEEPKASKKASKKRTTKKK